MSIVASVTMPVNGEKFVIGGGAKWYAPLAKSNVINIALTRR